MGQADLACQNQAIPEDPVGLARLHQVDQVDQVDRQHLPARATFLRAVHKWHQNCQAVLVGLVGQVAQSLMKNHLTLNPMLSLCLALQAAQALQEAQVCLLLCLVHQVHLEDQLRLEDLRLEDLGDLLRPEARPAQAAEDR